ncbi:hypothetical protein Zmor_019269 [Zophobas morio]|uniref:Uncharacterized protein n=1 Tax=Zophobas morio TaxID=2755281 RepID=A0AA38M8E3_9CUCU|nr:hypothetical protein Zmor_019269 [Zophobas morio]
MVERAIQTVKNIIKKCYETNTDLNLALLDYRNTPVSNCILSPSELLFNRKTRTLIPIKNNMLTPKNINFKKQRQLLVDRQNKQKCYYDRASRKLRALRINEKVYIRKNDIWIPGSVVRKFNDRSYLVKEDDTNLVMRRNRYFLKPQYYMKTSSSYMSDTDSNVSNVENNEDDVTDMLENVNVTDLTDKNEFVSESDEESDSATVTEEEPNETTDEATPSSSHTRRTIYVSKFGRRVKKPKNVN